MIEPNGHFDIQIFTSVVEKYEGDKNELMEEVFYKILTFYEYQAESLKSFLEIYHDEKVIKTAVEDVKKFIKVACIQDKEKYIQNLIVLEQKLDR